MHSYGFTSSGARLLLAVLCAESLFLLACAVVFLAAGILTAGHLGGRARVPPV
jgi:hypothetical protein